MTWNEKLKSLRGDKTIDEIANELQLSPDTYEAYEKGNRIPLTPVKKLIADYFKVTVEDIWS